MFGTHLQRKEADNAAFDRAFNAFMGDAALVGFGNVEGDVGGKRGFAHRRTTRQDQQIRRVQTAQFLIQINQPGGNTCKAAVALIGGVGHVHSICDRLEEGLKAALGHALFAQFVKPLFGLDDLFAWFGMNFHFRRFGRNIPAQGDKFAAYRKIINHLRIVARGIGGNRGAGQTHQISGSAKFAQAGIIVEKRFQRDG